MAAVLMARCKRAMRHRTSAACRRALWLRAPIAGPLMRDFEAELTQRLEHDLAQAGVLRSRLLAQLLLAASGGIADRATTPAELGPASATALRTPDRS